jgi:hypothetical protein
MKLKGTTYSFVILAGLVTLLLVAWAVTRRPAPEGQNWVQLSIPKVEFQTNAGVALPTARVRISNIGPQAIDFRLRWFECRSKRQQTLLATNRFASLISPLAPGESTNLTMDVSLAGLPLEEYWCCGEVLWAERESMAHRGARTLDRFLNLFDLTRNPRWYSRELLQGNAIASNVEVADYFLKMYGKSQTQWFLLAQKWPSIMVQPINNQIYSTGISAGALEEQVKVLADSAFSDFCRRSTNSAEIVSGPPK